MKLIFSVAGIALALFANQAVARDTYVRGHFRSDGSYVSPHYRSAPDGNPFNNYSNSPNYNPYTGSQGTRDPYLSPYSPYRGSNAPFAPRRYLSR